LRWEGKDEKEKTRREEASRKTRKGRKEEDEDEERKNEDKDEMRLFRCFVPFPCPLFLVFFVSSLRSLRACARLLEGEEI